MIGSTLNRRFHLDQELGQGGMGTVYRATDRVLGRSVAIKVLKEQAGGDLGPRLRLEAQILARLLHENIVRLYDFGESDGLCYFVMEEVDGASFQQRWRKLTMTERLRTLAEVADALDYAHHQAVIHRDVKPANVLMTAHGRPKLSDFGLSVLADQHDETGIVRGTPLYMSPEQARGRRIDHRADLYSLGVMLYECVTGSPPFKGPPLAVIASHVGSQPEPPLSVNPRISPAMNDLIVRLLAKDPSARPGAGAEVADELRDLLISTAGASPPGEAGPGMSADASTLRATEASDQGASIPGTIAASTVRGEVSSVGAGPGLSAVADGPTEAGPASAPGMSAAMPPVARTLLRAVTYEPIELNADERYLSGHYLAYLLGGSPRKGLLRRRPIDPINADRARLMLAMTYAIMEGGSPEAVAQAAELLELRPDIRPSLSPIIVAKYLATRDSLSKRKAFRRIRKQIQEASPYAQARMTDERGVLNPGLMPQTWDDLRKVAPARTELDDLLVERWNRVSEAWREVPDFRNAVLQYATKSAHRDPAGAALWPEVVYPLIERARWQRRIRSRFEVVFDSLRANLHIPATGARLDRMIREAVPTRVVEKLDLSAADFTDDPQITEDPADRDSVRIQADASNVAAIAGDVREARSTTLLVSPDPIRLTAGELRELFREALASLSSSRDAGGHRLVAIGPYRLVVIPSIRGRSAGQVAIQGMPNAKQVEMLTPSLRIGGSNSSTLLAVWVYRDDSLVIAYTDFRQDTNYILWHAPSQHQNNLDSAASVNSMLLQLDMEAPDQLDRALTRKFRPKGAV